MKKIFVEARCQQCQKQVREMQNKQKELIQAKPLLIRKVLITISSQSPFTPPDVHRSQLVSHHSHHFGKDPP
jgi:hypothetical protein